MSSCSVCVSVCLCVCNVYVTFVDCVQTNKDIFKKFSPSSSHTILVFPYQTGWWYSDRNPPKGHVECRCGRQKSRFWAYIWLHCLVQLTLQQARCCQPGRRRTTATVPQVVTLIYRWSYTAGMLDEAPRAIISHRRRGSTARDRPSALSHYTYIHLFDNKGPTGLWHVATVL